MSAILLAEHLGCFGGTAPQFRLWEEEAEGSKVEKAM